MLLTGIGLILVVSICIKLFDDEIRAEHWRKVLVNTITFLGLGLIIAGIVRLIIG